MNYDRLNRAAAPPDASPAAPPAHAHYTRNRLRACACVFAVCVLLALGIAGLYVAPPRLLHARLRTLLPLVNSSHSLTFSKWANVTQPVRLQVWLFTLLNEAEFEAGESPAFAQRGPYTYREVREKTDLQFTNSDQIVGFRQTVRYEFVPDASVVRDDRNDYVSTVNLAVMVIWQKMQEMGFPDWLQKLVDKFAIQLVDGIDPVINVTAHALIWGYTDPLLKLISETGLVPGLSSQVGLLTHGNNSNDGEWRVFTGLHRLASLNQVVSWNRSASLSVWTSDWANRIRGTDGTLFPPLTPAQQQWEEDDEGGGGDGGGDEEARRVYVFSTDICRSIYTVARGIEAKSEIGGSGSDIRIRAVYFRAPRSVFANASVNPLNAGFCTPRSHCLGTGLLNLTRCQHGLPVVMSQPNFFEADPRFARRIAAGIRADSANDTTQLWIEPHTGVVLELQKKLQINLVVEPVRAVPRAAHLPPRMYFPLAWLNESTRVEPDVARRLYTQLIRPLDIVRRVRLALIIVCALGTCYTLLLTALLLYRRRALRNRLQRHQPQQQQDGGDLDDNDDDDDGAGNDSNRTIH